MTVVWLVVTLCLLPMVKCQVTFEEYIRVRTDVRAAIQNSGFNTPLMAGCVRLGFHDCVGGCDGCVDLENPNNAGLKPYMDKLETIDRGNMSRADLWALCVVESIWLGAFFTPNFTLPTINFRAGRPESTAVCPERIFPDETKNPIPFLLENFPGLQNSTELAYALMGAHTLGQAHPGNSGHFNPWTKFPNWADNEYYQVLLNDSKGWHQVQLVKAETDGTFKSIYQWIPQSEPLMMLHVDAHLVRTLEFEEDTTKATCGFPDQGTNIGMPECLANPDTEIASKYAEDKFLWMQDFSTAIQAMIENGYEDELYSPT